MEKKSDQLILVFQKNMIPGKVKTRLAATIGDQKAMEIYEKLVGMTYRAVSKVKDADVIIYYSDYEESPYKGRFAPGVRVQEGGDLGQRMERAFGSSFGLGYKKIIIIGTDCPDISAPLIQEAFEELDDHQAVIGPAKDGGYYLLGMNQLYDLFFRYIPWSTDRVLTDTIEKLDQNNVSFQLLPALLDIDDEHDWNEFTKT